MLCLCLDCHVISSSGLQFYTYFWMAMLYHLLVCKFIPMSGLQVYTYFCYKVLYLLLLWLLLLFPNLISDLLYLFLVCNFIPTSVISNSGLFNFTGYGIVRYIIFRAPKFQCSPLCSAIVEKLYDSRIPPCNTFCNRLQQKLKSENHTTFLHG